jgi:hypothetical protein
MLHFWALPVGPRDDHHARHHQIRIAGESVENVA